MKVLRKYKERSREVNVGKLSAVDDEEREGKISGVNWEKVDLKSDGQVRERQAGIFHNFLEARVSNSQTGDIGDAQVSLSLQLAAADGAVPGLMKANIEDGLRRTISTSCPVFEAVDAQEGEFRKRQPSAVLDLFNDGPALGLCSFPTAHAAVGSKTDGDGSVSQISASFPVVPPPSELGVERSDGQVAGPSFPTAPSAIGSKADGDGPVTQIYTSSSVVPPPSELGVERSDGQGAGPSFPTAPSAIGSKADGDGPVTQIYTSSSVVPPPIELGVERSDCQGAGPSFPTAPSAIGSIADGDGPVTQIYTSSSVVPPPSELGVERSDGQGAGPSLIQAVLSSMNIEDGSNSTSWPQAPQGRGKAVVRRGRPPAWSAETREERQKRLKINGLYGDAPPSIQLMVNTPPASEKPFSQEGSEKLASSYEAHDTSATEKEKEKELEDQIVERAPTRCSGITLAGNRCTHNVKDGSKFCVKHTPKTEVDHSSAGASNHGIPFTAYKQTDIVVFRCRGITLRGLPCTHNVKDGGAYCLKHQDQAWGPPPRIIEAMPDPPRIIEGITEERTSYQTYPPEYQYETPHQIPVQTPSPPEVPVQEPILMIAPPSPQAKDDGAGGARCIGRTRRTDEQCSFRAKFGSLYCGSHSRQIQEKGKLEYDPTYEAPSSSLPSASLSAGLSLRKGRNQEVKNLPNVSSIQEQRSLCKAKDLFTGILNAGLLHGKVVTPNGKDLVGWVCEETTKDMLSGEKLLGLLAEEKEKLSKILIEDCEKLKKVKSPHFWETKYSPNLARTYPDRTDGDKNDALQRNPSGRFSSGVCGTSEARPSFAQSTRQGSESDRDVLTCALCSKKFVEMPYLAKHWKEDHKKEAFLFQKGMACSECGQEYTNKGGLLRHWKSTHPTLPIDDFSLLVCMICDAKFKGFNLLWMHVEDKHSLEFSNTAFAQRVKKEALGARNVIKCSTCGDKFDTQLEFSNHNESAHNGLSSSHAIGDVSGSSRPTTNGDDESNYKFSCRFCLIRFKLLPDLGRHHQAEHQKLGNRLSLNVQNVEVELPPLVKRTPLPNPETADSPPGKMLPLSEICGGIAEQGEHQGSVELPYPMPGPAAQPQAFNFRHLKTIAREKRKTEEKIMDAPHVPLHVPPGAPQGAPSGIASKKRRKENLGRAAKKVPQHIEAVQQKMQPQRPTTLPESGEILYAASVACCKESWYRELAKKHSYLDPHLHLQARALVEVMRPDIQWMSVEKFVCPNQCAPFHVTGAAVTALEVDMAGFSGTTFKAQADHVNDIGPASLETVNIKDVIKGKSFILNEDFSNGQEPVPIPCVVDEEVYSRPCSCAPCRDNLGDPCLDISEPWKCFSYTNKRLLDPSLGLDTESSKLGCGCGGDKCNPSQCDHVMMFDNDNDGARDKSGVAMKCRFPYDEQGRIILEEGFMVYECNSSCSCGKDCQNRVLQRGVRIKLEVFKSRFKGWGVRTAEPILAGTFVCEYTGEVLNDKVANQRGVRYDQDKCSYLYNIDLHLVSQASARAKPFVIDATKHGNVARFINHSCDPNLVVYSVLVESMDCQLAHIGLFARRDIGVGEELTYDYNYKLLPGKGITCQCGSSTCRGRLY